MKSSGKRVPESGRNIGAETFPACRTGSKKGESVCLRALPASRTARSPGRAEGGSGGESGGAASPYEVVQKKLGERRRDMEGSGRIRKDAKKSAQQGTARHVLRGAASCGVRREELVGIAPCGSLGRGRGEVFFMESESYGEAMNRNRTIRGSVLYAVRGESVPTATHVMTVWAYVFIIVVRSAASSGMWPCVGWERQKIPFGEKIRPHSVDEGACLRDCGICYTPGKRREFFYG